MYDLRPNTYVPKFFTRNAIIVYVLALLTVSILFYRYAMPWFWIAIGLTEVFTFFYFSNKLSKNWLSLSPRKFSQKLIITAIAIRIIYVIFSYFFYTHMTGTPFEFDAGDARFYDEAARFISRQLHNGNLLFYDDLVRYCGGLAFSDSGYPIYLGIIYYITSNSIFIARIIKAILSALTCLFIYKLATRNFGEIIGRISAVLCLLMPNLIYYCGLHLKETEMVFLIVLFIERADKLMRNTKFMIWPTLWVIIIGFLLFTFRTALGGVAFIAFFLALILTSGRVGNWGKRILIILLALAFTGLLMQDQIENEVRDLTSTDLITTQQNTNQWRARRSGELSQHFASHASAVIFAPMIFTIPFPTMVNNPGQDNQRMIHGGNFVKNITSFFTLIALFILGFIDDKGKLTLLKGHWREHVLPMAFLCGYLLVLVFSSFAHSERFHLPSIPFALIFAAFGIYCFQNKYKKFYWIWLILILIASVGWGWFKLKGRGMI